MHLQLLGPIEARRADRKLELGAPKQRALLAMLGLHANTAVSTDRLAEGLWGEEPPASAPKMVQLYVSQLRRVLDGNGAAIVTRGHGYELRLEPDRVDAARFERLVDEKEPRAALALWRGDALADVADEPFAAQAIRRLDELRLRAHELAIEADLAAGRHAEVLAELDGLVAEHPLNERLHAQRMLALYRSERQAEALDAYRQARAALVEQIGVEPGAELRRLQQAILVQDPALDLPERPRPPTGDARPAPAPHRRRPALLVAAAVLVAAAGLIAFGISRVTAPDRLARIDENHVGLIDPGGGRITAQYAVGRSPGAVVAGGGSVWVANTLDGTISRVDRDQVVTIDVGGEPTALAFGNGSLWVADGESRSVDQVDPGSNRVVNTLDVGNAPRAVTAGFGALWVASAIDGAVRRIDLDHPDRVRSIAVGANPTAIAAGEDGIWVASEESGTVTRLDPRTGAVVRAIHVGNGPSGVTVGDGAVWAANRPDGTVSRIDPATNRVSWALPIGGDPAAVAAGDGAVWVAGGSAGTVTRIDPGALQDVERVEVGNSAAGIAIAGGDVWTAAAASPASHRGGTLRLLSTDGPATIDWLRGRAFYYATIQLTSLAYDGLVGYRRVDGAAGATLVGALATDVPAPSGDGRTYVFTLRPGLRYSDGTPVRPEDFRASLERFLRVSGGEFAPYYAGIVGAEQCVERPSRCDLSEGIETDPRARAITVHLTRPDGDFLHKLTLPFAYVVPAGAPLRRTGDHAPPGTGPYRFTGWDSPRGGRMERNPYFRSTLRPFRPAGFADRIEVVIRPRRELASQVAQVRRGGADVVVLANAFGALAGPARLRALAIGAPGQLHSQPETITKYMFLGMRLPPFDDVRVRRALNYATDRARVVELEGGRGLATPTCQILPSGFPGHEPNCPYTARPGPARGWMAPDTERARALVAASGTAGERVTVTVPEFERDLGRYFARLLDELGYRASVRVIDDGPRYFRAVGDPRTRAQIGFFGWGADYAAPSGFVQSMFSCTARASRPSNNASFFCSRPLDRQITAALAAQGADAAARWAAIDHRLTDLAAVVPLTNRRSSILVSKRVGNVQHHQLYFTLLDQLWVR